MEKALYIDHNLDSALFKEKILNKISELQVSLEQI